MSDFKFENKVILILSPEKWGKMMLSKHHYAMELAKKGNKVYFLNPPQGNVSDTIKIERNKIDNLNIITYRKPFYYKLFYHFKPLFDFLFKNKVRKIRKTIGTQIDILWSFDIRGLYNLSSFNSKIIAFHPVDPVSLKQTEKAARSADIIIGISEKILDSYCKINKPKKFINHGLNRIFSLKAETSLNNVKCNITQNIKAGYFGNLLRNDINHNLIKQLVSENQNVEFNFWGPIVLKDSNIGGSNNEKIISFIKFLHNEKNVVIHGALKKEKLVKDIEDIDIFILFYIFAPSSDRSNAHKLIEYLATGKVIVANLFSTYKDFDELIVMPKEDNDLKLPALFKEVINNLDYYNSPELQKKRIEFALNNTYEKQIERIEKIINSIV